MERITLKHLAPYLPYGLKVEPFDVSGKRTSKVLDLFVLVAYSNGLDKLKPILRPLSDLTDDYVEKVLCPMPIGRDDVSYIHNNPRGHWKHYQLIHLFMNHFDVFGLIEKGLAIDINTLTPKTKKQRE